MNETLMVFEFEDGSFKAWITTDPTELLATAKHVARRDKNPIKRKWCYMVDPTREDLARVRRIIGVNHQVAIDLIELTRMHEFDDVNLQNGGPQDGLFIFT